MLAFTRHVIAAAALAATSLAVAAEPWQTIVPHDAGLTDVNGALVDGSGAPILDRSGSPMVPKCALGQPFKFFVQAGDPDKWVVFHTGGGACWNALTCASSASGTRGTYSPAITETAEALPYAGGILDGQEALNPFAGWTKVYVPYCTGDVGWGNQDVVYQVPVGPGTSFPLPIAHRGYANVRTVSEWIRRQVAADGAPTKVLVTGSSAGGYAAVGSLLPAVVEATGAHAQYYLIGDSANGIVTDSFLQDSAVSWGVQNTLADHVLAALAGGAAGLPTRVYGLTALRYPGTRLSQYQNAFDPVQSQFLNIMKHPNEPAAWADPALVGESLLEWTTAMRANVLASAFNPGYRFYTAAGYEHVVLQDVPLEAGLGFCSDEFATEASAANRGQPVSLFDWADDMVNRRGTLWRTGEWQNATCAPNCNVPPVCPPAAP